MSVSKSLNKIFQAFSDRKPVKPTQDLAHAVVPVVSLTILSALVGVNASKLPDNGATSSSIVVTILCLSLFFVVMEVVWEAARQRNVVRILVGTSLASALPFVFTPVVTEITKNSALVDGVFYGWIVSFLAVAFLTPNTEQELRADDKTFVRKSEFDD